MTSLKGGWGLGEEDSLTVMTWGVREKEKMTIYLMFTKHLS